MKKSTLFIRLTTILLLMIGVLVFMYPFVVDHLNSFIDSQIIAYHQKEQKAKKKDKNGKNERLDYYEAANRQLRDTGISLDDDPFESSSVKPDNEREYLRQHVVGYVEIPSLKVKAALYDTTNDFLLDKGATILQGTSYPIGGDNTHSVITAHSGLVERELFTNLERLKDGETFLVHVSATDEVLAYQVFERHVVEPEDASLIGIQPGKDLVTLLTCTPRVAHTHRLMVTGFRVPYTPELKAARKQAARESQWIGLAILIGTLLFLIGGIYLIVRQILNYRYQQKRIDFLFEVPKEITSMTLFDRRGKQPIYRAGEPLAALRNAAGVIEFSNLPRQEYTFRTNTGDITGGYQRTREKKKENPLYRSERFSWSKKGDMIELRSKEN